jgi:LEA14-like dessication related protein
MKPVTTIFYFLAIILLPAALLSCGPPRALEYREFKNLSIEKPGFSSSFVKMDIVYFNPNNYGLQLKRTDLDIFLNGVYLGHTAQEYQVTIPKKENFTIPLTIEVDMKNLFKNGLNLLFKDAVLVKVSGAVKVGKANVFISFPVKYEGSHTFTLFQ